MGRWRNQVGRSGGPCRGSRGLRAWRCGLAPCLAIAAVVALACQTVEHRLTIETYAKRPLAIASEEGARRFAMEAAFDSTVRAFAESHGKPDYLYVEDRQSLYFFYTSTDAAAVFRRDFIARSEVRSFRQIPGNLLKLLPAASRERVLASRARRTAKALRGTEQRGRRRRGPAAPAPSADGTGWSRRHFEVAAMVSRLRTATTAADTGITGWRRAVGPDGVEQRRAESDGIRFEVRPDAVTAMTAIASGPSATPIRARRAYTRINRAVFGTHAQRVNRVVASLSDRVSRDPSGKTRIAQRIAGRTVRIHRLRSRGWWVYSVHP